MQINGKTALVTGGTDGIGLELARQLKAKGAVVIVCGRREEMLLAAQRLSVSGLSVELMLPEPLTMMSLSACSVSVRVTADT